jgi:chromosome segregation ATPase
MTNDRMTNNSSSFRHSSFVIFSFPSTVYHLPVFIGAFMFTRLRRYCMSYLDAELATSVGELADMQREIVGRDERLAEYERRLTDIEAGHAQVATVLTTQRDAAQRDAEQLAIELADLRHELDKTSKALAVAEEENRRLWAVCQRDHARVAKERALLDRARAEAETAASVGQAEG